MPFSDFQSYWLITLHGEDAPAEWKDVLPVGCRFAFAQDEDGIWYYLPGQHARGPFGRQREAKPVSDQRMTVDFHRSAGLITFIVKPLGRKRLAIELWPPGTDPEAGTHGGAHGIDD